MSPTLKIAVLRYRFIGDTILAFPFLQALRRRYPESEIHLLVGNDARELAEHCPALDKVIPFEPGQLGLWGAVKLLRQERYAMAFVLKRSFSSALISFLAGIPQRIGFDTEGRGLLLTRRVPYRGHLKHEAECFLDLLPGGDVPPTPLEIDLPLPEALRTKSASWLVEAPGPHILLSATSTNVAKCWALENFQVVIQSLIEEYQAQVYCLGIDKDAETYETLRSTLPEHQRGHLHNLCGKTSLIESVALISHMDLVVGNDSGLIHMAAFTQAPIVAIFGPSAPEQWHPLAKRYTILTHPNLACRPCRMVITCGHTYPCLTEIPPEKVMDACKPYLTS